MIRKMSVVEKTESEKTDHGFWAGFWMGLGSLGHLYGFRPQARRRVRQDFMQIGLSTAWMKKTGMLRERHVR